MYIFIKIRLLKIFNIMSMALLSVPFMEPNKSIKFVKVYEK